MSFWLFIRRSLSFHARANFGVLLGAIIGTAALTGALIVGDSVRGSLLDRALERLGPVEFVINSGDRLFKDDLADRMEVTEIHNLVRTGNTWVKTGQFELGRASALLLTGTAARQDGSARANQINVLGIELTGWAGLVQTGLVASVGSPPQAEARRFFIQTGISQTAMAEWESGDAVFLNQTLAHQLNLGTGDDFVVRVRKPTRLAQDAVVTPREDTSVAFRVKVAAVLKPELLGDFSLLASQTPGPNAFFSLKVLATKLDVAGRANLLLDSQLLSTRRLSWWSRKRLQFKIWLASHGLSSGSRMNFTPRFHSNMDPEIFLPIPPVEGQAFLEKKLKNTFSPEDAQISVRALEPSQSATGDEYTGTSVEISSSRIFLEPTISSAALTPRTNLLNEHVGFENDRPEDAAASGFVTNGIRVLTYLANLVRHTDRSTPYSMITAASARWVPAGMRDNEILINEWMADDLQARPGDTLEVSYYVIDSASRLTERTNAFTVRAIVPLKGIYADRSLMPDFPGIAKAESTQDWDTGFPLVYKIREKDEAYWKQHRGTPKAFVTLAAGQAMWGSRFGNLTAIRYEVPTNSFAETYRNLAYKNLLANLDPAAVGLRFTEVRSPAVQAAEQAQDFGELFIGFSIFLVVAALLLMGMLFQFSLEQRQQEVGILLALGLRPKQVRRFLLAEGALLGLFGSALGALAGIGYAKAMLRALTTVWQSAIGTSVLRFYVSLTSLVTGLFAGTLVAIFVIWLTLGKQARRPARELLANDAAAQKPSRGRVAGWSAAISAATGLALLAYAFATHHQSDPEVFFEAGSLWLIAGLAAASRWLTGLSIGSETSPLSLAGLAVRGCVRRRKRSLATIALLASGTFLIVSISAFRLDANQDATKPTSGTGGFALIGQSALPVIQDLNSDAGREFFGLNPADFTNVSLVPFRVHAGDEASCLNLNRAQKPRLLGVQPGLLAGRFSFADAAKGHDIHQGWKLLKSGDLASASVETNEVEAIGDANSIEWALGKSVGDTLDYTDENGRPFKIRLIAAVANSVLQGSLIIDETAFTRLFPSESGHRFFLIDCPPPRTGAVSKALSRALQDKGLELTPAAERLNSFNAVQNTYLGTFQILGGLGLILGSAGLGVVVLRNVMERRGELGLLQAVGFKKKALRRLVLAEHGALLVIGLAIGLATATVAVLPAFLSTSRQLPYLSLAITLSAVLVNGLVWTWIATGVALRGNLLAALRNE
jgi:putative ABC transport system permease protein